MGLTQVTARVRRPGGRRGPARVRFVVDTGAGLMVNPLTREVVPMHPLPMNRMRAAAPP